MSVQDHDSTTNQQRLNQAIAAADVDSILQLLGDLTLDLDHRDVGHDLQTPLMRMCHMRAASGQLEGLVEKLERCAWNPNVQDVTGRTLLMHACIATRLPVVLLCLDNGCDVSAADRDGNSALVYAVRSGSDDIVRVILEGEECLAFLERGNNLGQTPLDIALQDGLHTIASLLSAHLPPSSSSHHQPPPSHHQATPGLIPNTTTTTTTLSPGSTFAPPTPMTPRSPVGPRRAQEVGLHRSSSDNGQGLTLHNLWSHSNGHGHGHGSRYRGQKGADREEEEGGKKEGETPDTYRQDDPPPGKIPGRASTLMSLQLHHPRAPSHSDLQNTPLTSRETTCSEFMQAEARAMTSREPTSCSEVDEKKSPRRAQRKKQRLLRRQTDDQLSENVEGGVLETPRGKPRSRDLKDLSLNASRKDYVSLPDLRDFKGKLVTSGEATPVSAENASPPLQPQNGSSSGKGGEYEDDEALAKSSYIERYKNGDLSASCSLPPLQSSSADTAERRKERGGKLMHRGKTSSTEEVMLRSLIV